MAKKPKLNLSFRGDPKRQKERTVIFVKSEAVQRHLIGELISKFERRGMKMVACKLIAPSKDLIGKHYPDDEKWYKSTGTNSYKGFLERGIKPPGDPIEIGKFIFNFFTIIL